MADPARLLEAPAWLRRHSGLHSFLRAARSLPVRLLLAGLRTVSPVNARFGPLRSTYSEFDLVRRAFIPGKITLPGQTPPVLPPDSLRSRCGLRQNEFQPWPVFWSHRRHARLVGTSLALVDEDKRLCLEAVYGRHCLPDDPAWRAFGFPPPVRLAGRWTSLWSRWGNGYYHWFTDALPRLAALSDFPSDTSILVPAEMLPYQRASLELLGLMDRVRPTAERHLVLEEYFFSSPTAMTGCSNRHAADFLRRKFLPPGPPVGETPRRIYLRRLGKTRGLHNEAAVLAALQARGWVVVDTEAMPLSQQINWFAQAEAVCALHGAGLTNLLWCRPGTKVIELCASTFLNGCYEGLSEDVGLDYRYLVCPADSAFVATVDVPALMRLVDEV